MLHEQIQKMESLGDSAKIPDFPQGLEWFNSAPLSFRKELIGKVVVLDFWTYCCINCIHVLPDLAELEEKYANAPVAFIGVHSAKFDNEKDAENIRQAILRYDITHPVVNDSEMTLWQHIGIRSWPSFIVVSPTGTLLFSASGEGQKETLDAMIAEALKSYDQKIYNAAPLPIELEKNKSNASTFLRFPGKLCLDEEGKRLFISDSNHHRVVIASLDGKILDIVGGMDPGFADGSYSQARFNRLQGLAYLNEKLFVADAENHAIREIDLQNRSVHTIAGNGKQGRDYRGGNKGTDQALSTPWDVVVSPDHRGLYIAMAGTHQIWFYGFENGRSYAFSGSGAEQNLNAKNLLQAAWAQPSGLCIGNEILYVADSESSSLRSINLTRQYTETLVGGDPERPYNLFCFGDRDGEKEFARLQHPLGLGWLPKSQKVIVADTYNHRLKIYDPRTQNIQSWAGSGTRGYKDGPLLEAHFSEPAGVAVFSDESRIYVGDANNHQIRLIDTKKGLVETMKLAL